MYLGLSENVLPHFTTDVDQKPTKKKGTLLLIHKQAPFDIVYPCPLPLLFSLTISLCWLITLLLKSECRPLMKKATRPAMRQP